MPWPVSSNSKRSEAAHNPDRGARLDRGGEQPVVDEFISTIWAAFVNAAATAVVAALKRAPEIARRFVPKQRRLQGKRLPGVDHGRLRPELTAPALLRRGLLHGAGHENTTGSLM